MQVVPFISYCAYYPRHAGDKHAFLFLSFRVSLQLTHKMTVGDKRITYRRRHSYNTRSNKIRKLKTPGS